MDLRAVEQLMRRFARAAQGNAVAEYALCLASIVLASISAVSALGVAISELFPDLAGLIS